MRLKCWGAGRLAVLGVTVAALLVSAQAAVAATAQVTRLGAAPASTSLSLVLPLRTDKSGLARFATAVSTPGSPQYGQYESIGQLVRRFGAPVSERAQVVSFLRHSGATGVKVDGSGLFADATMSVGLARRLFGADLSAFRTASATRFVAPTSSAHIPAGLAGAVTGVVGLDTRPLDGDQTEIPRPSPLAASDGITTDTGSGYAPRTGAASGCGDGVASGGFTPNQYRTAYGFDAFAQAGLNGDGERVALIEINGFKSSDIRAFAACFGLPAPRITRYGVGVKKPLPAVNGEATLDLEVLSAAAPSLKGIDIYESHPLASDVLHALTVPLINRGSKPDVISASLGSCESDAKQAIGGKNITTVESELQLAAASGISVLASSGDDGSSSCFDINGEPEPHQAVSFPASSPWVTSVGGTNFVLNPDNSLFSQTVWNSESGSGGGGYSILFKRPGYQDGIPARHRVVPDVAMLADTSPGYAIYCKARGDCQKAAPPGPWGEFGGTSAGTPLLAGGLALIDEALRKNGREDVGLANPLFYKIARNPTTYPAAFHDVVSGNDDLFALLTSGATTVGCCTAAPGFDPASGLGGVNLAGINTFAQSLIRAQVAVGLDLPRQRHPVRARHLLARVSCSGRCLMGAYASIRVGKAHALPAQDSSVYLLKKRSRRTIRIGLKGSTLRRLRSALAHRARIIATVYGVVVDPSGNIERRSRGRSLRIRG